MSDLFDRLTSRKFLLCVAGVLYVIAQVAAGAITPKEGLDAIQVIIGVYTGAEGIADAAGRLKPNAKTDPVPEPPPSP